MGRSFLLPAILLLIIAIVACVVVFIPGEFGLSNLFMDDDSSVESQNITDDNGNLLDENTSSGGDSIPGSSYAEVSSPSVNIANQTNEVDISQLLTDNRNSASLDANGNTDSSTNQTNPGVMNQIAGVIQNSYSKPVSAASVQLENGESVQTGADGRFLFQDLTQQAYSIQVSAGGYQPVSRNAVEVGTLNVIIILVNEGKLQGKVIDNTNAPVAYAQISIKALEGIYLQELRTDPDGRFELNNPPADKSLNIAAQQENFTDEGEGSKVVQSPYNEFVILKLHQPSYSISGMVLNQESGQGVSNFHLMAVLEDGSLPEPLLTNSSAGGIYRFENLKAGTYVLSSNPALNEPLNLVVPIDQDYKTVKVLERDAQDVNFMVESGLTVSGIVVNQNGQPAGGAEVSVAKIPSAKTISNFDGRFTLKSVPTLSGTGGTRGITDIRLLATHPQFGSGTSDPLPMNTKAPIENIRITLQGFAALSGVVVDRSDLPVLQARLLLTDLGTGQQIEQQSGPDGSFIFDKLTAAGSDANSFTGTHRINVSHEQYAPLQQMVSVQAGQNTTIRLQLDSGNQISGQVTDEERKPVPGTMVRTQLPRGGVATAQSDITGFYQFPNLPPGRYDLHFRYESNPPLTTILYGVTAGTSGANAVLKAGEWRVTGTAFDAQTRAPIQNYSMSIQGTPYAAGSRQFVQYKTINSPNGTYQLSLTEPGKYKLFFSAYPNYQNEEYGVDIQLGNLQLQIVNAELIPVQQYGSISGVFTPPLGTTFHGVNIPDLNYFPANGNVFQLSNIPVGPNTLHFYIVEEGVNAPRLVRTQPNVQVNADQTTVLGTIGTDITIELLEF